MTTPGKPYLDAAHQLRADLAAKDALLRSLADQLTLASEVLSRAAERGRVCARCRQAFTLEDLERKERGHDRG